MYFGGYYLTRTWKDMWDLTHHSTPKEYGEHLANKKRKKKKKRTKHK